MKNNKNGGLAGFLSGRGFYIAMAVCLIGAVTAAWVTVDRTVNSVNEKDDVPVPENRVIEEEKYDPSESIFSAEDVGKPKDDVKIEDEKTSGTKTDPDALKNKTSFVKPLSGKIIKNHSGGELVKYEALGEWRTHDGIDIAADAGSEIKACADGKILSVKNDPLWGTVVEIQHAGNIISIYGGLEQEVPVKAGDEVKAGDVIGILGETNLAETDMDSHLHFSMKENGKFIDPSAKIK